MYKITALLLALLLVFGLSACGVQTQDASSSPAVESSQSTSTTTQTTTASTTTATTTTTTTATRTTTSARSTTTTTTTTAATTTTTTTATRTTTSARSTTTTTTTTAATTTMTEKEQFLSQRKITHVGSAEDEKNWVYQLGFNGLMVREATIDSGRGGEPVEIVQVTDLHFNYLNERDLKENNPSVMSTYAQREHMKNGASRKNAELCMRYGSFFDQTVVTGDTIDYLTWGAIEMVEDIIWKPYPNTLIALGNHDYVRVMGLKEDVKDPTTLESRYQILQENWKHDIHYTSKVLKNKAMIIQMNNALYDGDQYVFRDEHLTKLEKDLATARSKGYVVLLFVHVPLATNNPAETKVMEIARMPKKYNNFYTGANPYVVGGTTSTGVTYEVWNLIMNSADVIRGVFAGHIHEDYYAEMLAKTPSGEDKIIPQYVNHAAFSDNGHVLKITVK